MDPTSLLPAVLAATATIGVGSAVVWAALRYSAARWRVWESVGARFGLTRTKRGFWKSDALTGTDGGVALVADTYTQSYGNSAQTFTRVTGDHAHLPPTLQVADEGLLAGLAKRVWTGDDVQIGDAAFDGAMLLRGPEDHLLAVLDAPTRSRIRARVSEPAVKIKEGQAKVVVSGHVRDGPRLAGFLQGVRDQVSDLALPAAEIPARLAANARTEPLASVRVRTLAVLAATHPDHPDTAPALAAALADDAAEVRLVAAYHQPARAADWPDRVGDEAVLIGLLADPHTASHVLACEALTVAGSLAAVMPLQALASRSKEPRVRQAATAAVRSLQARLARGQAGGLAVQEDPAGSQGGLAVAPARVQGQLSVSTDDEGSEQVRQAPDRQTEG